MLHYKIIKAPSGVHEIAIKNPFIRNTIIKVEAYYVNFFQAFNIDVGEKKRK